jgi:hypothetical protein
MRRRARRLVEQPPRIAVLTLIAAIPLIWPHIPPLHRLMGHMGRYRVELADPHRPLLHPLLQLRMGGDGQSRRRSADRPMSKIFGLDSA